MIENNKKSKQDKTNSQQITNSLKQVTLDDLGQGSSYAEGLLLNYDQKDN